MQRIPPQIWSGRTIVATACTLVVPSSAGCRGQAFAAGVLVTVSSLGSSRASSSPSFKSARPSPTRARFSNSLSRCPIFAPTGVFRTPHLVPTQPANDNWRGCSASEVYVSPHPVPGSSRCCCSPQSPPSRKLVPTNSSGRTCLPGTFSSHPHTTSQYATLSRFPITVQLVPMKPLPGMAICRAWGCPRLQSACRRFQLSLSLAESRFLRTGPRSSTPAGSFPSASWRLCCSNGHESHWHVRITTSPPTPDSSTAAGRFR